MVRYDYPHVIENGAGERLVFLRRVPGVAGDRLEGENVVKPGAGPPMHVHHNQEEALTVQQGRIGYQRRGEPPAFTGPGETVTFRRGEAHFLTQVFDSTRRNGGRRPDALEAPFGCGATARSSRCWRFPRWCSG